MSSSRKSPVELVLGETLACTNCDDPAPKIEVWCMECFTSEKDRTTPVALCKQCNIGLHTPAKLSLHRRQPFRCNTDRMRTPSELKLGSTFPPKFPDLCSLMCSNCEGLLDDHMEAQWCIECALILCKDCSRDLHAPQKKKVHQRYPFSFRFISAQHLSDENGTIEEASIASRAPSAAGGSFKATHGSLLLNARATMPASLSSASSSGLKNVGGLMKTANLIAHINAKKKQGEAKTNTPVPGDVIQMSEPALTGPIECTTLMFKNTFNDFDTIGAVQIIQICCGNKHAGAVTAGGSLFMWGQNANFECGFDSGEEKEIKEPQIIQIPGNKPVRMIACGFEHSACITRDNAAFSWGSGLMGILGHASDINRETPTEINLHWNSSTPADPKERLVYVACGPHNTGIVCQGRTDRKQIYTFGAGEYGTLGTGSKIPSLQPQLIHVELDGGEDRYPEIAKLAFGTNHTVAVATNGLVFSFGSNSFGQLGYLLPGQSPPNGGEPSSPKVAGSSELQLKPRLVDALSKQGIKVTHAACGELSTSVLTDTGAIYSWGSGETHQLGIMDNVDYYSPVRAAVLGGDNAEFKAVSLDVGVSSCAAVTESGDVYMWGWSVEAAIPTIVSHLRSNHMQAVAIGAHDNVVCLTGVSNEIYEWRFTEEGDQAADVEPKQNRSLRGKRLVSISVGKGRCAAATAAGVLLEWGADTRDPDAPDEEEFDPYRPREIRCAWSIAEVKCSADHSVALTTDGKCLTWGLGGGKLGHPSADRDYSSPTLVDALKDQFCTSIAIGPRNTGVTTKEFKAFVWGAGNSGQLGNNDINPVFLPTQLAALQQVEIIGLGFGNRHLIAVCKDGSVYGCGDNGLGQLGLGVGSEPKYLRPQLLKTIAAVAIAEVACGDNVTMLLSNDGRLFAFGAGETNQIPGHQEDVYTPLQIMIPFASEDAPVKGKSIKSISVATINCAALADNGSVWVWGWALGENITRVDYMAKQGFNVTHAAMGPSSMLLSV